MFTYITMRAIMSALTALLISLLMGPLMIRRLSTRQIGQTVRTDGPETHLPKAGTPTMGGALILVAILASTLLWADLTSEYVWIVVAVTLAFGLIGFVDDYKKLILKDPAGLSAGGKIFWQSVTAIAVAVVLYWLADQPYETALLIPYLKGVAIPLGFLYIGLTYLVIVGTSNAVNLTDGLDGLAIMPAVLVGGALGIFGYATGNVIFSDYLGIPYILGAGEMLVFCSALAGAGPRLSVVQHLSRAGVHGRHRGAGARRCARHSRRDRSPGTDPVRDHGRTVRDGNGIGHDPGRLVQADRASRVFRMAPLHHHFELKGWAEPKVIVRFWIITVILVLVGSGEPEDQVGTTGCMVDGNSGNRQLTVGGDRAVHSLVLGMGADRCVDARGTSLAAQVWPPCSRTRGDEPPGRERDPRRCMPDARVCVVR